MRRPILKPRRAPKKLRRYSFNNGSETSSQPPKPIAMRRICFFLIAIGLFASSLWADFQIPENPDGYVTDRAGLLSSSARANLEAILQSFESQTSNQVVVATFPSMEDGSLEDISVRLAQQWKIGQKARNNGVLFLIFKNDRAMRIEVGYGLEGVLTDALSAQIVRNEVTPYFRAGEFEKGILSGVRAILSATKGEYQADAAAQNGDGAGLLKLILIVCGVLFAVDLVRYGFYLMTHLQDSRRYGFFEWFVIFAALWFVLRLLIESSLRSGGRGWTSGGGSSSGGGFSGGGGSFGGGGASGRW